MLYGEEAIKSAKLEAWDNPYPDRDYTIEITFPLLNVDINHARGFCIKPKLAI